MSDIEKKARVDLEEVEVVAAMMAVRVSEYSAFPHLRLALDRLAELEARDGGFYGRLASKMQTQRDIAIRERDEAQQRFTRVTTDALAAMSQFSSTPEEGYAKAPFLLSGDIQRLGTKLQASEAGAAALREALECAEEARQNLAATDAGKALLTRLKKAESDHTDSEKSLIDTVHKVSEERDEALDALRDALRRLRDITPRGVK